MKKKIKYTDGPVGKTEVVEDFLPAPEDLVFKEENVKVTLNLKKSSVIFFKNVAKSNRTKYQKVIRNLLDKYASHFQKA
jgi:predicted DNA binding CopG/RHH family protein